MRTIGSSVALLLCSALRTESLRFRLRSVCVAFLIFYRVYLIHLCINNSTSHTCTAFLDKIATAEALNEVAIKQMNRNV